MVDAVAQTDELIGRTLGEFVVRERIGEGGFGAVYRAQQALLAREAVIKVLQTRLRRSEVAIQRFLREARLASRIDHPYAAHIYAFGVEHDGLLWIAMELVDGTPLDVLLEQRGRLALADAVPLLERLCEVVHTAHDRGIVHRDIKPSNVIVLQRAGQLLPKLLDLGIAKLIVEPMPSASASVPAALPTWHANAATPRSGADAPLIGTVPDDEPAGESGDRPLTQAGAVLGSPPYMAPELWVSSAAADERSDVYALGVLAFELFAGRRPFDAPTVSALHAAHADQPVPALGADLPAALDDVLRKALAKQPADRHRDALELARALRAAAGLSPEQGAIPRIPGGVRDAWIAGAPQPVAEAIAALDAARSQREARDGLRELVAACGHVLGIFALATHVREPAAVAHELVRDLRRRCLADDDWSVLAEALATATPFGELRAAAATLSAMRADWRELLSAPTEARIREHLAAAIERVPRLLDALGWLRDVPLGVVRGGRVELWMGVRRQRRAWIELAEPVADGTPVALTASGQIALVLAPLVCITRSAPAADDEWFMFAGSGPRGARWIARPVGFEHHEDATWDWLGDSHAAAVATASAPYLGLAAFTRADAARYFGREREVEAFCNRLRVHGLLAVVGASGSGKSSFVHAGVLPQLPAEWRAITIRPGPAPLAALEVVLRELDQPVELAARPEAFARAVRRCGAADGTVVIVVDQFEEVFTQCREPSERLAFADALAHATRSAEDRVRVVLTLRGDFLLATEQLPALRERIVWGLHLLATPSRVDLLRIVTEPVRRLGYAFEDALAEQMVDATAGKPAALALIAFTAAELWEQRDVAAKRLPRAAYEAMGGVAGALARHADSVFEGMVADDQRLARDTFRHVLTAEGTRAAVGRGDLRRILAHPHADAVIARLIDARLLVGAGDAGEDLVELVHEALVEAWPRLRDWLRDDADDARARDQLRTAARQWHDRGRPSGLLWRGDALAEYVRWRERHPAPLGELDDAFAAASIADARRGRRIRRGLLAGALGVLTASVIVLVYLRADAERLRDDAHAKYTSELVERGRAALIAGDSLEAARALLHAYDEGARGRAFSIMLARAVAPARAQLQQFRLDAKLRHVEVSPDGKHVLAVREGDPRIALIELATGRERTFDTGSSLYWDARFDRTGDRVVSGLNPVRIWNVRDGSSIALGTNSFMVVFSDDNELVVTSRDHEISAWRAATGEHVWTTEIGEASNPDFATHADIVVTSDLTGAVDILRLTDGQRLHHVQAHHARIRVIAIAADGTRVATAAGDPVARVWDTRTGSLIAELPHQAAITDVIFDHDGSILTTSADRSAKLWSAGGMLRFTLQAHLGKVITGAFDPVQPRVATAGNDGRLCLFERERGTLLECLVGHRGSVTSVAWSPTGDTIVSGGMDGTVRRWRGDARAYDRAVSGFHERYDARLAQDGTSISVVTAGRVLEIREPDGVTVRWSSTFPSSGFFDRAGRGVLGWNDHGARVWDVRTGAVTLEMTAAHQGYWAGSLLRDAAVLVGNDGWLEIHPRDGRPPTVTRIHTSGVLAGGLDASPDETRIATGGDDHTVAITDVATATVLARFRGHTSRITGVAFSPDGEHVASTSHDSTVRIWSMTGHQVAIAHDGGTGRSPQFIDRGDKLVTGHDDGTVRVWSTATGQALGVLRGHDGVILRIAVAPDGRLFASASADGTVIVWDSVDLGAVLRLTGHADRPSSLAFDSHDHILTGSGDGTIKLWTIDDGGDSLADELALARELAR